MLDSDTCSAGARRPGTQEPRNASLRLSCRPPWCRCSSWWLACPVLLLVSLAPKFPSCSLVQLCSWWVQHGISRCARATHREGTRAWRQRANGWRPALQHFSAESAVATCSGQDALEVSRARDADSADEIDLVEQCRHGGDRSTPSPPMAMMATRCRPASMCTSVAAVTDRLDFVASRITMDSRACVCDAPDSAEALLLRLQQVRLLSWCLPDLECHRRLRATQTCSLCGSSKSRGRRRCTRMANSSGPSSARWRAAGRNTRTRSWRSPSSRQTVCGSMQSTRCCVANWHLRASSTRVQGSSLLG